ncbi:MAG: sugar phosphate nucleotidyltransferase [Gemmatimonadaceae bacterium]
MRKADESAHLPATQAAIADIGLKAMIPMSTHAGRPFLDYVLSSLADTGFTNACIVIGPEHAGVRDRYERQQVPTRIRVTFAIQERALGTANAVLSAEDFVGDDSFAVLNSDNFYPREALDALHEIVEPAIIGFDREVLVKGGNVPPERTARFGALDIDSEGYLRRILVSPTDEMVRSGKPTYSSMNCFLFTREIFRACRDVPLSMRGEYELPQAVHLAIDRGEMRFRVVRVSAPVLDMSSRGDIAGVSSYLERVEVKL